MNVQNRKQFDQFLKDLKRAKWVVADSETDGLDPYGTRTKQPNKMISLSVYFPEFGTSYNLPFRHGMGQFQVDWGSKEPQPFEDLTWAGKAKKSMYMGYWFDQYRTTVDPGYFKNLPLIWLDEIKKYWGMKDVIYVFHNAKFDLHVFENEGMPLPFKIEDTMLALHLVQEDWRGIEVVAPFKWAKKDHDEGHCSSEEVGTWALDSDGELILKKQYGNRQLKWQSALHGFDEATAGETTLRAAIKRFEATLTDFICTHPDHPYNDFAVTVKKATKKLPERKEFKRAKIEDKVQLDEKAQMWMLPSEDVAYYAELDTKLTWQLREWAMGVMVNWGNEDLYATINDIQLHMAWKMENNGFKIDRVRAEAEIAKLEPRIAEVEEILQGVVTHLNLNVTLDLTQEIDLDEEEEKFNPNSNPQLVRFLNCVLGIDFGTRLFPSWWDEKLKLELQTYPGAKVSSTKKKALELYENHPVVRLLKNYRMMQKSVKTYLYKWLAAADANDIVRGNINVDGTVAGRCSSSGRSGNFQNIPDRNGYTIKEAIIPYDSSWVFWAIDYGQLELRLACDYAERRLGLDKNMTMTKLFESGADMHSWVRDDVDVRGVMFGKMSDEAICLKLGYNENHKDVIKSGYRAIVDKYCRQVAKTMNFGLLYSGTEYMLSNLLSIELAPAKVLVTRWKERFVAFPRAQDYYTRLAETRRDLPNPEAGMGMYATQFISGRHRKLHLYPTWKNFYENGVQKGFNPREASANKVWNNMVQGEGGYLCTASAMKFMMETRTENVRMFAQIHDALDGFVRVGHEHEILRLAEIMVDWDVRPMLTVDVQRSYDGTWQGIGPVVKFYKDAPDWAYSKQSSWDDPVWQAGMAAWLEVNQKQMA